jgi:hypothetical protein
MSGPTMASAQARDEGVTSEPWICEKCNVFVSAPLASKNNKRICPMGHTVEQPMSFLGGAFGVVLFVVAAAAAAERVYRRLVAIVSAVRPAEGCRKALEGRADLQEVTSA